MKKFLQTELDRLTTSLLDTSDANTPIVQGMGRECRDILILLRDSPELAEKIRKA